MSDIFISYARSTEVQARRIGEALRALGYGVWRDDEIPAHRSYADVIRERLTAAKAVVVVWSADAAGSQWVQSEADRARADGKLIQLTVDGAELPMPFDRIQCANLKGWTGDDAAPGWRKVVESIAVLTGPGAAGRAEGAKPATPKLSICVLPFANMSGEAEQEYFSDGISEDIITDLSKVSALSVVSRNTAFTFKGKSIELPRIAASALAILGEADRARDWVRRALLMDPDNQSMRYNLACGLSADLRDVDGALELLGPYFSSVADRSMIHHARIDPDLDPLRDDPRFIAMMAEAEARLTAAPSN